MADPKAGDKQTLVEEGTELKGSLTSSCPIVVRGRIDGEVAAPSLTVSASGAVHGRAKVGEMRSQGELAGEFDADVVQLSGRVMDRTVIRAKSLEVKLTPANGKMQVIFGECELDVGGAPQKADEASKSGGAAGLGSSASAASAQPKSDKKDKGKGGRSEQERANGTVPPPAGDVAAPTEGETGLR